MYEQPRPEAWLTARYGHVDRVRLSMYPPERGRGAVREDRVDPAGEDGGHPAAFRSQPLDGVDAAVQPGQAAGGGTMANAAVTETQLAELSGGDHPVLVGRKLANLQVGGPNVTSRTYSDRDVTLVAGGVGHVLIVGREDARWGTPA